MSPARRKSVTSAAFSIAGRLAGEAATAVAVGMEVGVTVVETTAAVDMVGAANLRGNWKRECTRLMGRRRPLVRCA